MDVAGKCSGLAEGLLKVFDDSGAFMLGVMAVIAEGDKRIVWVLPRLRPGGVVPMVDDQH